MLYLSSDLHLPTGFHPRTRRGIHIEYVAERRLGHRLRIFGFSCVHYGDKRGHDKDKWRECLEDIDQTENAVVFGLGDYLDWTRTTYRLPLRSVWGEDDKAFQQLDDLVMEGMVYPFVDTIRKHCPSFATKCVGFVEGNHHGTMLSSQFRNGKTTTEVICELLGIRYLGLSAWVRLTAYRSVGKKQFGAGHNLNIVLNHSVSSAGNLPSSLASAKRKIVDWRGVDIFLSANDHQLGHDLVPQIGCSHAGSPREMQYQQVVAKVGSFQKGYSAGAMTEDYVEKKFLSPSRIGYLAFDAWVYHRESTPDVKAREGRTGSPEVWRFSNFNI